MSYEYEYFDHALSGTQLAANPKNELTLFRTWNLSAAYAFSERLTMNLLLPYRQITAPKTDVSASNPNEVVRFTREFSGVGDAVVMAQYLAKAPRKESPLSLGVSFGFRLPTGSSQPDHQWAGGLSRDPVLQVGAGTLDPIAALSAGYTLGKTSIYASALGRISNSENIYQYRYGNEYQFTAGVSSPISEVFDASLTASTIITKHDFDKSTQVGNTGGTWLYLTPSVTFRAGDINTGFSLQLPLYQNVNLSQLSSNYVFNVNLACGFNLKQEPNSSAKPQRNLRPTPAKAPEGFSKFIPEESPQQAHQTHRTLDIETISLGEKVILKDHTASGKITVFEFYGDKCLACADFEEPLRAFISENSQFVLRKINIGDGESQVVNQFNITVTPTLIAIDDQGNQLLRHNGASLAALKSIVQ